MSPFAIALREFRSIRRLRQSDAAEMLGCEQTYVSALELGVKGPPPVEFIDRVVDAFDLDDVSEKQLRDEHLASQRRMVIPADAPENVYRFFNELRRQIDRLHPAQIELMQIALRFPEAVAVAPVQVERLRRRVLEREVVCEKG